MRKKSAGGWWGWQSPVLLCGCGGGMGQEVEGGAVQMPKTGSKGKKAVFTPPRHTGTCRQKVGSSVTVPGEEMNEEGVCSTPTKTAMSYRRA